jgi:hypothetical protein
LVAVVVAVVVVVVAVAVAEAVAATVGAIDVPFDTGPPVVTTPIVDLIGVVTAPPGAVVLVPDLAVADMITLKTIA